MKPQNYSLFTIHSDGGEYKISKESLLDKKQIRDIDGSSAPGEITVITDPFEYQGTDQVLPIQPEQIFFMDQHRKEKIRGGRVLEIGLGSGVLSIFTALQGASKVVGLDINPRAKILTGFNSVLNGTEDVVEIRDGSTEWVFKAVENEEFDYIISNPPFEPTPPGMDYYMNSAAGIYGLDFLEMLLKDVENLMSSGGHLQFVTMAPGDKEGPFLLKNLLNTYFPGKAVDVIVDTCPIGYKEFNDRFTDYFGVEQERIDLMNEIAEKESVTHIYMCMIHYTKGEKGDIRFIPTHKVYEPWETPLGTAKSNSY